MKNLSRRELLRRLRCAQDELSASLFFMVPPVARGGAKRASIRHLRYEADQRIRQTVSLCEALETGDFQDERCGACGRIIGAGVKIVSTGDGPSFHATERCWGSKPSSRITQRTETRDEINASRRRYIGAAKVHLKKRGLI